MVKQLFVLSFIFRQTFTIHEDEEQPAFCPIMSFLALAFADKAFKANELLNPGDLQRIQISSPLRCQKINWKDSILDTPVLRQVDKSGVIQACAWKYSSFQKKLVQLGKATGFEKNVTIYCARRETGNLLNSMRKRFHSIYLVSLRTSRIWGS